MAKAYARSEEHGVSLPMLPSASLPLSECRKNAWGEFTACIRSVFSSRVPKGYEDQEGFHYEADQSGCELPQT